MLQVGLEIHGYINTKEKLFCSCRAEHGLKFSKPNTNICPVCTGQPGAKPMLPNSGAISRAIQIALILNCRINNKLIWKRKHYDWPDLPKGYQNTLSGPHSIPVGENGKFLGINIRECHLEEDPAAWNPKTGEIDYNRSGSPLIEIVTEPDFTNSEEVINWLRQLITILDYIKAIDKTSGIKADVNVSVTGGMRVEIKNINGLKKIQKAIEYEFARQKKPGELPKTQETRMFDDTRGITKVMRTKEQTEDYRFISDPDLPVIKLEKSRIEKLKKELPETPAEKLTKLVKKYKIEKKHAEILTKKLDIVEFFEKIIEKINPKLAVRWVTEELLSVLNYNKKELDDTNIIPEKFIGLLKNIEEGIITELNAKDILRNWAAEKPATYKINLKEKTKVSDKIDIKKFAKISDKKEIEKIAKKVMKENPKAVADYKSGKKESLNFLIGQVMKASNKRADYNLARDVLEREIIEG
jgi:aspartyl-tRNA(Asn)/glutamyl-tRNA(Gln) amidotransferase subunit B